MSQFDTTGSAHIPVGSPRIHLDNDDCNHSGGNVCPACAELTDNEVDALRSRRPATCCEAAQQCELYLPDVRQTAASRREVPTRPRCRRPDVRRVTGMSDTATLLGALACAAAGWFAVGWWLERPTRPRAEVVVDPAPAAEAVAERDHPTSFTTAVEGFIEAFQGIPGIGPLHKSIMDALFGTTGITPPAGRPPGGQE